MPAASRYRAWALWLPGLLWLAGAAVAADAVPLTVEEMAEMLEFLGEAETATDGFGDFFDLLPDDPDEAPRVETAAAEESNP